MLLKAQNFPLVHCVMPIMPHSQGSQLIKIRNKHIGLLKPTMPKQRKQLQKQCNLHLRITAGNRCKCTQLQSTLERNFNWRHHPNLGNVPENGYTQPLLIPMSGIEFKNPTCSRCTEIEWSLPKIDWSP